MLGPFEKERLSNWVADFCGSDALADFPAALHGPAPQLLNEFIVGACAARGVEPDELEEADFKVSLLGPVARLALPETVRGHVPALCGAFLEQLEREGRLGGGRAAAAFVRALREPFVEAATGKPKPARHAGAPIGRNDPCPCGSGLKYKKCCQRA